MMVVAIAIAVRELLDVTSRGLWASDPVEDGTVIPVTDGAADLEEATDEEVREAIDGGEHDR